MIVLYTGRRGSGKTLTMVKDAIKFYNNGWKVISNIHIVGIEYTYLKTEDIINMDKNSEFNNCVLVIDEIQVLFDSRRSSSKDNKNFSNFIQQIRKRNIIVLCTTQFAGTTDLRIRQHTDVIARPSFKKEFNVVDCIYYDITSSEEGLFQDSMISKRVVFNAFPIFELYNTNQTIV